MRRCIVIGIRFQSKEESLSLRMFFVVISFDKNLMFACNDSIDFAPNKKMLVGGSFVVRKS